MAKRVKTKKGSIGKKALAAILAASMVLSSSVFSVLAAPFPANGTVTFTNPNNQPNQYTYTGSQIKPAVTVNDGQNVINDVSLEYIGDTVNVGTPSVKITFNDGKYEPKTEPYKITQLEVNKGGATAEAELAGLGDNFVYSGEENLPTIQSVKVQNSNKVSLPVTANDYEMTVAKPTNKDVTHAGMKSVQIKAKGNYSGMITIPQSPNSNKEWYSYWIQQADVTPDDVQIRTDKVVYDISNPGPRATLRDSIVVYETATNEKVDSTGYTLQYRKADGNWTSNASEIDASIGVHEDAIKVTLKEIPDGTSEDDALKYSNFKGEILGSYEIISGQTLANLIDKEGKLGNFSRGNDGTWSAVYTGSSQKPVINTIDTLKVDDEYKVEYGTGNWKDVGEYNVTITGTKKYKDESVSLALKITPKSVKSIASDITAVQGSRADGTKGSVIVKAMDGQTELVEGTDYTLDVADDSKTVTVTGIGNYKGSTKVSVTAPSDNKFPLTDPAIEASVPESFPWTGSDVKLKASDVVVVDTGVTPSKTLEPGKDYKLKATGTYKNNNKAGTAKVVIEGQGEYGGEREVEFKIVGQKFDEKFRPEVKGDVTLPVTGGIADIKKQVKVYHVSTGAEYTRGIWKILNSDGDTVDPVSINSTGTYTAVITPGTSSADKQYEGEIRVQFEVVGKDISSQLAITVAEGSKYTGEEVKPAVSVKWNETATTSKVLTEGKDYTLEYGDNKDAGPAYVTVKLTGEYSGTKTEVFNIAKVDGTVTLDADQKSELENGAAVGSTTTLKLVPSIVDESLSCTVTSSDEDIVSATGKTLTFKKAGTAEITIDPTSRNLNITSEPIKVTVKVTAAAPAKKLKASCTPSRLKNVKNSFTVTTNTVKGADKWIIRYSLKNLNKTTKGSAKVTVKNTKKVNQRVVKVNKSGAKYYVQCRVVKNGVKSAWSKVKTVTSR